MTTTAPRPPAQAAPSPAGTQTDATPGAVVWGPLDSPFELDGSTVTSARKDAGSRGVVRSRPLLVSRRYLAYSIAGTDFERHTCLDVVVGDEVVRSDTGRGTHHPRRATFDLGPWLGREVRLVLRDESGAQGWVAVGDVELTDRPAGAAPAQLYREALRPAYHFTARQWTMDRPDPVERQEGWLNDLNGLVVMDGEYHLFAQRWNKCWIHAVSPDLVHWTELPPAFFEEDLGAGVQSGTCVVDVDNTSGLGTPDSPAPMVAFWSGADNLTQGVSYSLDRGRTWTAWAGNPIMLRGERDPMVFRDSRRDRWCMVLYAEQRYELLVSHDLLRWEPVGDLGEGFECPDFFELPVEGTDETRWVLVRGDGHYSVGSFDGTSFAPETDELVVDGSPSFYATQSWDATSDGVPRRVQAAWMRGSVFPRMPFNQQVSVPCDLTLRRTDHGLRLHRTPVPELAALERRHHGRRHHEHGLDGGPRTLAPGETWSASFGTGALRLRADVDVPAGGRLDLDLAGRRLVVERDRIVVDGAEQPTLTPLRRLDVLLDVASVEVFANDGEASLTVYGFAGQPTLRATARDAAVVVASAQVAELDPIWP
ncbi:GH32 C-terminal domain-containing protein [Isoptericola sp. NPDC057191]|uniref:GH32 C-terminal domain-containing protein n=1 Tax=Isoptericola sp. NPDC057191 TaxID=3346041 RepID=UPI00362524D9